jgi:hypothetical protein
MNYTKIVLALIIIPHIFLSSEKTFSDDHNKKEIGLIIVVKDGKVLTLDTPVAILKYARQTTGDLVDWRVILITPKEVKRDFDKFLALELKPGEKINYLILGTHGATKKEATVLQSLGGFSEKGIQGILKDVFQSLQPYLSSRLNIFMEACSTFCGSEQGIIDRTKGLFEDLKSLGVRELSIWGARQPLTAAQLRSMTKLRAFFESSKGLPKVILNGYLISSAITGIFAAYNNDPSSIMSWSFVRYNIETTLGAIAASTLLYADVVLVPLFKKDSDSGYSVIMSETKTEILSTERYSPRSFGMANSCAEAISN